MAEEPTTPRSRSPWEIMWRKLRRNRTAMIGLGVLVVLYAGAIFAPFLSPYGYATQFRTHHWTPPQISRIEFWDDDGVWRGPFIHQTVAIDDLEAGRKEGWKFLSVEAEESTTILLESRGLRADFAATAVVVRVSVST